MTPACSNGAQRKAVPPCGRRKAEDRGSCAKAGLCAGKGDIPGLTQAHWLSRREGVPWSVGAERRFASQASEVLFSGTGSCTQASGEKAIIPPALAFRRRNPCPRRRLAERKLEAPAMERGRTAPEQRMCRCIRSGFLPLPRRHVEWKSPLRSPAGSRRPVMRPDGAEHGGGSVIARRFQKADQPVA